MSASHSSSLASAKHAQQVVQALSPDAEGQWKDIFSACVVPYLAPAETRVRKRMRRVLRELRRAFGRKRNPLLALKHIRCERLTVRAKRLLRHRIVFSHIHDELHAHTVDRDPEDWESLRKRRRVDRRPSLLPSVVRERARWYSLDRDPYYERYSPWNVSDASFQVLQCDGHQCHVEEWQWEQLDEARRILSIEREDKPDFHEHCAGDCEF